MLVTVYFIVALPAFTPVTRPELAFTVATDVLLLLHVPPEVPLLVNVVVEPLHTDVEPLIVPALAPELLTVNVLNEETGLPHPVFTV